MEFPILRKHEALSWGLSFNNSRTVNMTVYDRRKNYYNNWVKKYENEWTWVTVSYNEDTREMYFYVNDELVTNMNGVRENKPFLIEDDLRKYDDDHPFILGYCSNHKTYFKGQISEVKIFDKFFDDIDSVFENRKNLILHLDFQQGFLDKANNVICEQLNTKLTFENFEVNENIIPVRKEGNFLCMGHEDEGFVNGKWKKGKTTAKNEKRFVTQMQQRKIDYKKDGLKQILDVLDVENIDETLYPNTMFINCKMRKDVSRI